MLLLYNNLQSYALELKRHMETTEHTSRTRRRECFALERERAFAFSGFFFVGEKQQHSLNKQFGLYNSP